MERPFQIPPRRYFQMFPLEPQDMDALFENARPDSQRRTQTMDCVKHSFSTIPNDGIISIGNDTLSRSCFWIAAYQGLKLLFGQLFTTRVPDPFCLRRKHGFPNMSIDFSAGEHYVYCKRLCTEYAINVHFYTVNYTGAIGSSWIGHPSLTINSNPKSASNRTLAIASYGGHYELIVSKTETSDSLETRLTTEILERYNYIPESERVDARVEAREPRIDPRKEAREPRKEGREPEREDRAPKAEARAPRVEDRAPKAEARAPRVEDRAPKAEERVPRMEDRNSLANILGLIQRFSDIEYHARAQKTDQLIESAFRFHEECMKMKVEVEGNIREFKSDGTSLSAIILEMLGENLKTIEKTLVKVSALLGDLVK
jgi:hypothetical protein